MINLPRVKIAHLPTRIEYLPRISSNLGGIELYIKRDDQTGLAFGGNKTRKLEFLIGDALAKNAQTLITTGAVQSNHCRQTAAAAAKFGLKCFLVLTGQEPEAGLNNSSGYSGNLLIDKLLDAKIVYTGLDNREKKIKDLYQEELEKGNQPYIIPYGGSNKIGAYAYSQAINELMIQVSDSFEDNSGPDWIVFPTSSGGTQAGMIAGARKYGYKGRILGISVDEKSDPLKERIAELANQISELIELEHRFTQSEVLVNDKYLGDGYGVAGGAEKNAIEFFARNEGILLDPVYTGRAAAGLLDLHQSGFFREGKGEPINILFWHTGGTPALLSRNYESLW